MRNINNMMHSQKGEGAKNEKGIQKSKPKIELPSRA
jgi:hypothetical protein